MATLVINQQLSNLKSTKHQIEIQGIENQTKYTRKKVNCLAPGDVLTVEDVEKNILSDPGYVGKLIAIERFSSEGCIVGELKGFFDDKIIIGRRNEDKENYPDLEMEINQIKNVYLVVQIQLLSSVHHSEDGMWGKENSINGLIESLTLANEVENKQLISILEENKRKPIKEIRKLIQGIDYTTTQEYGFSIEDSLFDIYYTEPEWEWE